MRKIFLPSTLVLVLALLISCNSSKKVAVIDFFDGSYTGEVDDNGKKHGKGTYRWIDGSFYEGDFKDDLRHGLGKFKWANGESYNGEYLRDQRTGIGIYSWSDNSKYNGSFLNGKRHGKGTFTSSNGAKYDGEWFDDLRHGQGVLINPDGQMISGIWQNGKLLSKSPAPTKSTIKPDISLEQPISNSTTKLVQSNIIPEKMPPQDHVAEITNPIDDSVSELINQDRNDSSIISASDNNENSLEISNHSDKTLSSGVESPDANKFITPPDVNPSTAKDNDLWIGTVNEVEINFITKLIDGIDTVFDRSSNVPYSGKMRIIDNSGSITGELKLLKGRMHGEELYFENKILIEKNLWENGKFIKTLPM